MTTRPRRFGECPCHVTIIDNFEYIYCGQLVYLPRSANVSL